MNDALTLKVRAREEAIRMALAEVGQTHVFGGCHIGSRWDGMETRWAPGTPIALTWRATELAAMHTGRKTGPICLACHNHRRDAYNAGADKPGPCESEGRWLLADCGRIREAIA